MTTLTVVSYKWKSKWCVRFIPEPKWRPYLLNRYLLFYIVTSYSHICRSRNIGEMYCHHLHRRIVPNIPHAQRPPIVGCQRPLFPIISQLLATHAGRLFQPPLENLHATVARDPYNTAEDVFWMLRKEKNIHGSQSSTVLDFNICETRRGYVAYWDFSACLFTCLLLQRYWVP
jgi:hypothetical protein